MRSKTDCINDIAIIFGVVFKPIYYPFYETGHHLNIIFRFTLNLCISLMAKSS